MVQVALASCARFHLAPGMPHSAVRSPNLSSTRLVIVIGSTAELLVTTIEYVTLPPGSWSTEGFGVLETEISGRTCLFVIVHVMSSPFARFTAAEVPGVEGTTTSPPSPFSTHSIDEL